MCISEDSIVVLPSIFDEMCSKIVVDLSHLKSSSKVYIRSENYNIICYIYKNYFYKCNLKIGNCLYVFDSNDCRSIVFKTDDDFYCYFKSDIEKIEIKSINPEINNFDLFNKSVNWNDDYYKLFYNSTDISVEKMVLDFNREIGNISSVRDRQNFVEFFAYFVDNNLTRFDTIVPLINFIMYSIIFNNDYKLYNFYNKNSLIENINLAPDVNYLLKKINELYNYDACNVINDFEDFALQLESMHLDEQYKYSRYFINSLIFTFRELSRKNHKINFKYIMKRFFTD